MGWGTKMEDSYKTIEKPGFFEYEEKKSRFLGAAFPVKSEEEAEGVLSSIRKEHYKARHHCSAMVLGQKRDRRRSSDDGEPSGTAGMPILNVIDGAGCTDVIIVVTRYFGGTLLGTGGLVRAYTQAAQGALKDAGIVTMCRCREFSVSLDYTHFDKVTYYLKKNETDPVTGERVLIRREPVYADKVTIPLVVQSAFSDLIREGIMSAADRTAQFEDGAEKFMALH